MPADDDPPGPDADPAKLTGTALLHHVSSKLAAQKTPPRAKPLFRVVEVVRDPRGRLSAQGQIWHSDLDHVRRFGHALSANSASQQVLITDGSGTVVERIPVRLAPAGPPGWTGWRDLPLPPLPPRPKLPRPRKVLPAVAAPPGPTHSSEPPALTVLKPPPVPGAATPPREIPVVVQVTFDPEATATLAPAPPP